MAKITKIAKTAKNRRVNLKIPKMTQIPKTVKNRQKGCPKKGSIFGPPTPQNATQPSLPPGGDRPFWPIFWPLFCGPSKNPYSRTFDHFKSEIKVFQKCPKHAIFWHVFRPPEPQNHGFWPQNHGFGPPFWPLFDPFLDNIPKYAYFPRSKNTGLIQGVSTRVPKVTFWGPPNSKKSSRSSRSHFVTHFLEPQDVKIWHILGHFWTPFLTVESQNRPTGLSSFSGPLQKWPHFWTLPVHSH